MDYVEDDPVKYNDVRNSISNNSCVLVLGPQFAANVAGVEICKDLHDYLGLKKFSIDADFQNLFITKDDKVEYSLKKRVQEYYNSKATDTTNIFREISRIKFPTIVCFTQDSFLPEAYLAEGYDFRFDYYSVGASERKKIESLRNESSHVPLIYNLYGIHTDFSSIVSTYQSFYKFLFSILGNDGFLSTDLKSRISDAECILFLGFDWKDPYFPLLIRKIFHVTAENGSSVMAAAAMNNTDTTNAAFINWLGRYPLNLDYLRDSNAFVTKLITDSASQYQIFKPDPKNSKILIQRSIPQDVIELWKDLIRKAEGPQGVGKICDDVASWANVQQMPDLENFAISLSGQSSELKARKAQQTISDNEYLVRMNVIRLNLLSTINPNGQK